MTLLAVAVDALSLVVIYATVSWMIPSRLARAGLVLVLAASAATHWEVAGNLANLHWFLLVSALFVSVDMRSDGRWLSTVLRAGWLVVACLSEGLSPLIAGAYVGGVLLRRASRGTWRASDVWAGVVTIAASAVQTVTSIRFPRVWLPGPPQNLNDVSEDYRTWIVHWGWAGPTASGNTVGRVFLVAIVVLVVSGVVLAIFGPARGAVCWRLVLAGIVTLVASYGILAVSVIANHYMVSRYVFVPFTLLIIGSVVVLAALFRGPRGAVTVPVVAVVSALVATILMDPYPSSVSVNSPSWNHEIAVAQTRCRTSAHPGTQVEVITAAPSRAWTVDITCRRLTG